jgi:glycerol-3-phosphate cytidylyltransferase
MKKNIKGYTTGVYDLFHIGHLNVLKEAKKHCDFLVVGVTSDELSLLYKGKKPVIPFNERIEIIRSLKYVDEAVEQDSMDKFMAWQKIKFNRMYVGDDWKGTQKWIDLEKKFKKINVDIIYFPYTKNTSSTLLKGVLEKIK